MKRICFLLLIASAMIVSCQDDDLMIDSLLYSRKDFILAGETGTGIYSRDLIPDWEAYAYGIAGDSISMDINRDFVPDVRIQYNTISATNSYIVQTSLYCLNGAAISIEPKIENDSVHKILSWSASPSILGFTKIDFITNDTTSSGAWISSTDKFLGVKITVNGRITYGWIKMSLLVHPATVYVQKICVKEFAGQKVH